MNKNKHVLGISGGKDSAALALYLNERHPQLDIDYYFCDTGRELDETYELIEKLETVLNKRITPLEAVKDSPSGSPFDHYLDIFGGYLPSSQSRWCTRKLKLEPFEEYVGDDPVISYVGIRGDENREAYISAKSNIQSIFPFRKNIWSEDVIGKLLSNTNTEFLASLFESLLDTKRLDIAMQVINRPLSPEFEQEQKLNLLLDISIPIFNQVVFQFLKSTEYPLATEEDFPLLENEDVLVKEDIFRILRESGVGVPQYYEDVEFEINGQTGTYARTRSGCFFCFFQQKIEWVWLYEQHPERFQKAVEYEKDGYTWMQDECLEDLIKSERIQQIKKDHLTRLKIAKHKSTNRLLDILEDEEQGCAACFI